jgi:hypothetical protein
MFDKKINIIYELMRTGHKEMGLVSIERGDQVLQEPVYSVRKASVLFFWHNFALI